MATQTLWETTVRGHSVRRGKVRDIYDLGDRLLIVTTDRLSAFDVVLPDPIPHKGRVLTALSRFWFNRFAGRCPHHLVEVIDATVPAGFEAAAEELRGRAMLCRKAEVIPIECVARGYLAGSGWKEYQAYGTVCGIRLPPGLRECERLPEPIFTPATKAETGHDENISFETACRHVGEDVMRELRDKTLTLYREAASYAAERGILVADTKFEFGRTAEGIILIDEVLTPDSSRFWPADRYAPGRAQQSFDKQYVRDYLERLCAEGKWDKTPPGPALPEDVIEATRARYVEAYERITRERFAA
ncbi:MAG: phosphoribosylaminoimidazolesuccinocarboxamide synthase [Planctomycetota bacterium]|nr:MAG: phosphoribosylaminoimidazolesuccinocarboxamide synthase [Planctomycetota bacterium]